MGADEGARRSSSPSDVDAQVLAHFESTVVSEWERMTATFADRVSLELHLRLLARHVHTGDRVLEVGAGAGRFSLELARLAGALTVTDISPAQLAAAAVRLRLEGLDGVMEGFDVVDVRDLSRFGAGSFDVVCAFGGPLSYCFEGAGGALEQVASVLRPGGTLVASVMSNAGASRAFGERFAALIDEVGLDAVGAVVATGDLRPVQPSGHTCQMYYADELVELVDASPLQLLECSASSWLATGSPLGLERACEDPAVWEAFVDWEEAVASRPGALDGGTHLLFAARTAS